MIVFEYRGQFLAFERNTISAADGRGPVASALLMMKLFPVPWRAFGVEYQFR